ncbi:MAG: hypothetical protein IJW13_04550 [Clostridia bacterium]|nr:hypothetical protein [Clostridia bacterium]
MLNLLIKDFKLMFSSERSLSKRIISGVVTVLFVACFVVLEIFLFSAVLNKIKDFRQAPEAFMTLFLAVVTILMIVAGVLQAKKLFFNEKDIEQLTRYPVTNSQIILSKLIFLFFSHYATAILFVYPLFIAYGQTITMPVWFYYIALFYPVVSFFFEMGIALLVVYPVWMFSQFLKKHLLLEFGLAMVLLLAGTYAYSNILSLFIELVANNQLSIIFSTENITKFVGIEKYLFPINFLTDVFVDRKYGSLWPYLSMGVGIFSLGLTVTIFTFHYVRNLSITAKSRPLRERKVKITSPIKALIKKEISLLTKGTDYIFTFSGLLIVQPFLLFMIVSALNTIFSAGLFRYYVTVVPNFITLIDFLIIVMFTLIINQGANNYVTMEERTIKNMKTIPISYKTQLIVKMMIPFAMSFASLFLSSIVLVAFGAVSVVTGIMAFLFSTVSLFVFDVISLREELHIRHGKPRTTYISSIYSYLLPFSYVICGIILSYLGTSLAAIYLAGILLIILLGLPHLVYVKQNMGSLFMDLEAIN